MTLLEVEDLQVSFNTPDGVVQAVRGVSYHIEAGQTLGIVGESGSGKSVSTQTIMGLTKGAQISGRALFEGQDLLTASPDQMRAIRGAKIGMVFQDPLSSLHPYYKVGWQIIEMIRLHDHEISKDQAVKRAVELLRLVGIPQPDRRVNDYPHQFSGGMRQRAMIAMAMALNPALLIADEPTTALDVTVQAQVLRVIRRMQEVFGTAVILITHDLGVIADVADDVPGDVRGQGDGAGRPADTVLRQPSPVHRGTSAVHARLRRRARAAAPDRGSAAEPARPSSGLPVRATLCLRDGPVPPGGAPARPGGRGARAPFSLLAAAHRGRP